VTLLNWTGEPLSRVGLAVHLPFVVRKVESMRSGPVTFRQSQGSVAFSLRLGGADIVTLRP
jgi:hypothetical protein